jgi:hypothetical protein
MPELLMLQLTFPIAQVAVTLYNPACAGVIPAMVVLVPDDE